MPSRISSRVMPLLIACALLAALPACNTMRGLGQDIQSGGRALEGSAERNRTR
jgi:predicted small secreted protein